MTSGEGNSCVCRAQALPYRGALPRRVRDEHFVKGRWNLNICPGVLVISAKVSYKAQHALIRQGFCQQWVPTDTTPGGMLMTRRACLATAADKFTACCKLMYAEGLMPRTATLLHQHLVHR